ncbi:MAG TPA: hypothetical protein VLQ48_16290 [Chloroflexia bacterium]|nr:hypothetical protein [Chloroflexia bacterium]
MAKKTTRTSQQQRARQEQWRRRIDAQTGQPTSGDAASVAAVDDAEEAYGEATDAAENAGYMQADMRPMPSVTTATTAAKRSTARTGTTSTTGAVPTPGQRRALAASRTTRARLTMNTMSLEEEMHYVRADIRKLITLTIACLAIIIILSFVLNR